MKKFILLLSLLPSLTISNLFSQGFPWERPLKIAWSNDGITFLPPTVFQDSAGVPSVIRWKGDTLISAFQWFRVPVGSFTWDKVAVKFSYDNGITWNEPVPIIVNGLPGNYQRPFDPTLVRLNNDSIRIYFSSSDGMPNGGLDSTVNTYSAKSADGINYIFEPNARVDELSNRVIDPAVIFFNNGYHYLSPIGSPQQGAYHYVSPNGINFMKVPDIPSNNTHNWTGNYMLNDTNEMRFYGAGANGIWFNSTANGGVWNGYVNTNLIGGDPSAIKITPNDYLIIFVGAPYATGISIPAMNQGNIIAFPDPAENEITFRFPKEDIGTSYAIYDGYARVVIADVIKSTEFTINIAHLSYGTYFLIAGNKTANTCSFLKK